jgi:hypothetical protein
MSQQQRHQFSFVAEPPTEPGLQLGASKQQLLAAWEMVRGACSILLLNASARLAWVFIMKLFRGLCVFF